MFLSSIGYHIVGSHSGVKMCRWTKSMLRGRGGCYKHTFYGIESHRCMETTPSLACANKCVFCWRFDIPNAQKLLYSRISTLLLTASEYNGVEYVFKRYILYHNTLGKRNFI